MAIDPDDVRTALETARWRGGSRADVYLEHRDSTTVRSDGGAVTARADRDVGAAVRVTVAGITGYSSTNVVTREGLREAAEVAAALAGGATSTSDSIVLAERRLRPAQQPLRPPSAADTTVKADLVHSAAESAHAVDGRIRQVVVTYVDVTQHVLVATSDGAFVRDARTRTRMTCRAVARTTDKMQAGFEGAGLGGGLELFDQSSADQIGQAAAARAVRMLEGIDFPGGEDVVIVLGQSGGGLLLHEACGHGLEADGVVRGTSIYAATAGARLARSAVTAIDDPSLVDGFGSYAADDEGRPATPTVLIEQGIQTGVMTDVAAADRLGGHSSANGRRESFAHPPLCRMSNTYLAAGTDTPTDIVSDVPSGLYVARLSGGDVDIATGDFAFTSSETYLIEHGHLTRPVARATLLGNGPKALGAIDGVGYDLAFTQAMCGKESQWVPVSYGAPTLRIPGLTVTGS